MVEFVDLPGDAVVMRIAKRIEDQFPPGAVKPNPLLFRLTDADDKEAKDKKRPPLLSVYDTSKTTIAQVKEIRGLREEVGAFGLKVEDACSLQTPVGDGHLRVVEDPLSVDSFGLGADGHAGILGLAHKPKPKARILRLKLRDMSRRLRESDPVFERE